MTECLHEVRIPFGFCEGLFPDNAQEEAFQQCYYALYNHPGRGTDLFDNVWAIWEDLCNNVDSYMARGFTELPSACDSFDFTFDRVFNVSMYFKKVFNLQIATYVYPPIYGIACVLNLVMFCFITFKTERSISTIFMAFVSFNEFAITLPMIMILVIYVIGGFQLELFPANTSRFILIMVEMVPNVVHALSSILLFGLLLHRYLLIAYPLSFKTKFDKPVYAFIFTACAFVVTVVPFIPTIVEILSFPVLQLASKIDHSRTVEVLVVTRRDSTLFYVCLIQNVLVISGCIILQIKCVKVLRELKHNREKLTTNRGRDVFSHLTSNALNMIGGFLFTQFPYVITLFFIATGQLEKGTSVYIILNMFTTSSYIVTSATFILSFSNIRSTAACLFCHCQKLRNLNTKKDTSTTISRRNESTKNTVADRSKNI